MNIQNTQIRENLRRMAEPKYRTFALSLIPNCTHFLGVRIPKIRALALELVQKDALLYLEKGAEMYFEEKMLKALVIGNLKEDIYVVLRAVRAFVPKIDNWSICDSFCNELKITRKNKEKVWAFLQPYFVSQNAYDVRFAVVMGLFYFIEQDYLKGLLNHFDNIKHSDYYVKMGVAWAISICFVHFPETMKAYLAQCTLDTETYNKAIDKITQSLRVDKSTKDEMRKTKRRKYGEKEGKTTECVRFP